MTAYYIVSGGRNILRHGERKKKHWKRQAEEKREKKRGEAVINLVSGLRGPFAAASTKNAPLYIFSVARQPHFLPLAVGRFFRL